MKALTNYRYWILAIVASVAFTGTFSVPEDSLPLLTWTWLLVSTKAVGLGGFYLCNVLIRHWEKRGTIPELTQFKDEFEYERV